MSEIAQLLIGGGIAILCLSVGIGLLIHIIRDGWSE